MILICNAKKMDDVINGLKEAQVRGHEVSAILQVNDSQYKKLKNNEKLSLSMIYKIIDKRNIRAAIVNLNSYVLHDENCSFIKRMNHYCVAYLTKMAFSGLYVCGVCHPKSVSIDKK